MESHDRALQQPPAVERYATQLRWLHWAIAGLVTVQFALILVLHNLQALNFGKAVLGLHQQCGLLVLTLILIRFGVSWWVKAPHNEGQLPGWQVIAARLVHGGLAAQPVLGMATAWARGEDVRLLGFIPLPAPVALSNETGVRLESCHRWLAYSMLSLLALHLGAVAFNKLVRGTSVIERMMAAPRQDRFSNRVPLIAQLSVSCCGILAMTFAAGLYSAHKYSEFNALRSAFEEQVVSKLDTLRDAQLSAHDMLNAPTAQGASSVRDALRDAMPAMGQQTGRPDALAAAQGFDQLAKGNLSVDVAKHANAALDSAVAALTMDVFQRRLAISQTASEGHDMIVLVLGPTVIISAIIAFILSRRILLALGHARRMVTDIAAQTENARVAIFGNGEFAGLLRAIVAMEGTISHRERERHEAESAKSQFIVDQLAAALAALARGDLATRLETPFPDQTEQIRNDFNAAIVSLNQAMLLLGNSTQAIDDGAGAVRIAADQLAHRTERQAGDLNTTVQSFNRFSDALKLAAQDSVATKQVMTQVWDMGSQSGSIVEEAISAMADVEHSATLIVEIIAMIDQIAMQTNMLALNAGIEAARAGDAGRGFAIVASEVRSLAKRTGEASQQVRSLVAGSEEHIARGVDLVRRSGESMSAVLDGMTNASNLVVRMADLNAEQANEIQGIKRSLQMVDVALQQNAAMVEETNAAMARICSHSRELSNQVSKFQIEDIDRDRSKSRIRATNQEAGAPVHGDLARRYPGKAA